jgi:hypothetical protein
VQDHRDRTPNGEDGPAPAAPTISRRRTLLFLGIQVLLTLLALEVMLQGYYYATAGEFLFRRTVPPIYAKDDTRCFRLASNLDYIHRTNEFTARIYTNSQGFRTDGRTEPYPHEKDSDLFRVLVLGPSFAMGWASDYEDTYASLIEQQMRVEGRRVEVINIGTPSQGADLQLCWLEQEGYKYQPDLIVQTSYGQAISRLPAACPEVLSCPEVVDGNLYKSTPSLTRRIAHGVKNFAIVFYGYYAYSALVRSPEDADVGVGKELYSEEERKAQDGDLAALVSEFEAYVDFVRSVTGAQTEVAFIHIPLSFVVHPEDVPRWSHISEADPASARVETQKGVDALLAGGLNLIDTTPGLIAAADDARMYFWLDIHLTPEGNRVVAERAIPALERWISAKP